MSPNDATNEELRDWLATKQGWGTIYGYDGKVRQWNRQIGSAWEVSIDHPIPNTIDAAAKCLPEGWIDYAGGIARAAIITTGKVGCVTVDRTSDEATDRFRLAVKAIMAMEEGK